MVRISIFIRLPCNIGNILQIQSSQLDWNKKGNKIMLELMETSKKEITTINEGMLKNATTKINQFHKIAKNAILGISMVLSDIAEKPKEYLENTGFNTIAEYTEEMFGYKKAYTYKLIKIAKFISIKSINGETLAVSDLISDKINVDYTFETIKDGDGFEFSPSQMLEIIPLTDNQFIENIEILDSSLTCKELREIVKNIVNPPIETTGTESEGSTESEENKEEDKQEEKPLTDKERIMQMLEICSGMEEEGIKEPIIKVFQKALKALEK